MLKPAIRYALQDDWVSRILAGGIFTATSVILLPAFTLLGYFLRVLEETVNGVPHPPDFEGYLSMTKDGFVAFIILGLYTISPLVLFVLTIYGLVQINVIYNLSMVEFSLIGFIILLPVTIISLTAYYIVPVAMTNYAIKHEFRSAFQFSNIIKIAGTKTYIIGSILPVMLIIISSVLTITVSTTGIGVVIVPFIQFFFQMIIIRLFAITYRKSETSPTITVNKLMRMTDVSRLYS